MRLGEQECILKKNSNAYNAYKINSIFERHRHRYEFNNKYKKNTRRRWVNYLG